MNAATATPTPTRRHRLRYVVAAILCVSAVVAMLVLGLRGNIVYFRTVSEAVHKRAHEGSHRFRLGGDVIPSSVTELADGQLRFDVTDGKATVTVVHSGDEPAILKSNVERGQRVPVVCEGRWGAGTAFASDKIIVKHGSNYEPPKKDFSGS